MLETLKNVGKETMHEYSHDLILSSLPPRRNETYTKPTYTRYKNIWFDKSGIKYELDNNKLFITVNSYVPETLIQYINSIPNNFDLKIIINFYTEENELASFNLFCNYLAINHLNKNIILNISDLRFGIGNALEIERLPQNVKISNCFERNIEQNPFYGENSFDWWALHCDSINFQILLSKLTNVSKKRALKLRNIVTNFYKNTPTYIKNGSNKDKCDFVYNWCCKNISYDFSGTMIDGTYNYDRPDTTDPIVTFEQRKGICTGRARLFKVLLNNYYMNAPVFLVNGMAGRLRHEWNELIIDDNKSIFYDISKQRDLKNDEHRDYLLSKDNIAIINNPKR